MEVNEDGYEIRLEHGVRCYYQNGEFLYDEFDEGMGQLQCFIVIERQAYYDHSWIADVTLQSSGANPAQVFRTLEEAEAYCVNAAINHMKSAPGTRFDWSYGAMMGAAILQQALQESSEKAEQLLGIPLTPTIRRWLQPPGKVKKWVQERTLRWPNVRRWIEPRSEHPAERFDHFKFTDRELGAIARAIDARYHYIVSASMTREEWQAAFTTMQEVELRPEIYDEYTYAIDFFSLGTSNLLEDRMIMPVIPPDGLTPEEEEAVKRLERVTKMFGRHYAKGFRYG